jgi:hypothetical protein
MEATGNILLPLGEGQTQRVADALAFFDAYKLGYAANGTGTSSLGSGSGKQSSPVSPVRQFNSSGGGGGAAGGAERVLPSNVEILHLLPARAELGEGVGSPRVGNYRSGLHSNLVTETLRGALTQNTRCKRTSPRRFTSPSLFLYFSLIS